MSDKPNSEEDEMWAAYNRFHYVCDTRRFQKMFVRADLVRMVADIPGDIVDAGAFKGISTIQFAHLLKTYQPHSRSKVVAFDTFEALFPRIRDDEQRGADNLMSAYEADTFQQLTEALKALDLDRRVKVVRGDITETLPQYIKENPGFRISLLHCDLDAHEPTLATLKAAWPRIVSGGLVVFDEYAVEAWGESDAADEFFATLEHKPVLKTLPASPTPTAYCVKE